MRDQPRYEAYEKNTFFEDGRASRLPVEGTVARGQLQETQTPARGFPMPVTDQLVQLGRERFDIYCSVCHDRAGSGRGMIVQRGFPAPPTLHSERLRNAPEKHFFDVITNGFGRMPALKFQMTPEERWAVIAYVRALQLSYNAPAGQLPAEVRSALDAK